MQFEGLEPVLGVRELGRRHLVLHWQARWETVSPVLTASTGHGTVLGNVEGQGIHPVAGRLNSSPRRCRNGTSRAHIVRDEVGYTVIGVRLELVLDTFIDGVPLLDQFVDDKMQRPLGRATREDVVSRLGDTVTDQEEALLGRYNFLCLLPGNGAMVPGMGAQITGVQGEFPFEGLFQGLDIGGWGCG